ncbi:MAG: hypothetical protein KDK97_13600, partial [Verrucomicrobiales bacterium]|nr:hypothetical protein [Verrucomicrobiales bacterium]
MRHLLVYLSLALLSGIAPALAQNRALLPLREWTSSEGARLKAELIGFEGDGALLRYEDGRRVTVPEERFSPLDRAELVRARLLNLHWERFVDSLGTSFFQSYKIPEQRAGKEMATVLSFGPNRFSLAIYLITSKIDWRKFDQVICDDGSGRVQIYAFKPDDVSIYGEGTSLRTRVVVTIQPGRNEAFIPILKDLVVKKQVSFKAHSTVDGKSEVIALSPDETAALGEMLAVYEKAAALVREGVIQRAPLQQQTFGAPAAPSAGTVPGPSVAGGVGEAELAKYKNQRMDSRLGEITWTPPGGAAEKVEGLGWIRTSV